MKCQECKSLAEKVEGQRRAMDDVMVICKCSQLMCVWWSSVEPRELLHKWTECVSISAPGEERDGVWEYKVVVRITVGERMGAQESSETHSCTSWTNFIRCSSVTWGDCVCITAVFNHCRVGWGGGGKRRMSNVINIHLVTTLHAKTISLKPWMRTVWCACNYCCLWFSMCDKLSLQCFVLLGGVTCTIPLWTLRAVPITLQLIQLTWSLADWWSH